MNTREACCRGLSLSTLTKSRKPQYLRSSDEAEANNPSTHVKVYLFCEARKLTVDGIRPEINEAQARRFLLRFGLLHSRDPADNGIPCEMKLGVPHSRRLGLVLLVFFRIDRRFLQDLGQLVPLPCVKRIIVLPRLTGEVRLGEQVLGGQPDGNSFGRADEVKARQTFQSRFNVLGIDLLCREVIDAAVDNPAAFFSNPWLPLGQIEDQV